MKISLIIFTLCLLSFIEGNAYIRNLRKNIASAGVITYENLRSKVMFTYLHKDFRNDILLKFDEEKYENLRVDIDWRSKIIHAYYLKRIYLPDRWHELYYFYSVSAYLEKSIKKRVCKRVGRTTRCDFVNVPQNLDRREVDILKNEAINKVQRQIKVEFSNTVDENLREQFYSQYPHLRN